MKLANSRRAQSSANLPEVFEQQPIRTAAPVAHASRHWSEPRGRDALIVSPCYLLAWPIVGAVPFCAVRHGSHRSSFLRSAITSRWPARRALAMAAARPIVDARAGMGGPLRAPGRSATPSDSARCNARRCAGRRDTADRRSLVCHSAALRGRRRDDAAMRETIRSAAPRGVTCGPRGRRRDDTPMRARRIRGCNGGAFSLMQRRARLRAGRRD